MGRRLKQLGGDVYTGLGHNRVVVRRMTAFRSRSPAWCCMSVWRLMHVVMIIRCSGRCDLMRPMFAGMHAISTGARLKRAKRHGQEG